jgi:hypothetical protein
MLEKQVEIDQIEIVANGSVQVRQATKIFEDGVELSKSYHRWVICPGQDYSDQIDRVKAICAAVHTSEVIAAWNAKIAATENVG